MNRKLSIVFLLLLFFAQNIFAGANMMVMGVEIEGYRDTPVKKIRKAIKTRVGKEYSEYELNKDIENIYELNNFNEVMVDVSDCEGGVNITFIVVEKHRVKRIDFKGNRKFKDKTLKNKIGSGEKKPFDRKQMIDDVDILVNLYKEKGYSDVTVEPFTSFDDEGQEVALTFFITEGNKIKIGKINFIGVNSFRAKKIHGLLDISKGDIFKPEELEEESKKIGVFYKNEGFINYKPGETLVTYNKDKTEAFITVFLYEGKSYRVGEMEFNGNSKFKIKELRECIQFKTGDVFSEDDLNMSLALMHDKYAEEGYIKVSIVPEYDMDDEKGIADIEFKIIEGGVIYINDIYIEGNTTTKDFVIRREFLVKSGDVFDLKRIRRSQEKIYNLGFFQDLRLDLNETEYQDRVDLILSVEEQMSGMISAGLGYSYEYGLMGTVQLQWNNLFGRGQRINLMADFGVGDSTATSIGSGGRTRNFQFSFTEPWLMGRHILAGFDIFSTYRHRDAWSENRTGVTGKIGPHLDEDTNLLFAYTFEGVTIPEAKDETLISNEAKINSTLSAYLTRDTRDNIFDATRGSRLSVSLKKTGGILGGDNEYEKVGITGNVFIPLFWKFVLGAQARFGGLRSNMEEVPIYERYFVGGGETVRGYEYGFRVPEIGAIDGGKLMFVSNIELKVPLAKQGRNTIVQGVLFLDIGGTWNTVDDIHFTLGDGRTNLKAGIGFGVRFTPIPMFPIRLDWGIGLNTTDYKGHAPRELKFYLTIGPTF